ncbi:MAG: metallophosphoesterase, partial [Eubacteriales bacterium]
LYTNDVHCAIDENIGYAGLAAYKKSVEAKTKNVTLIDCGDAVQGGFIGTVSDGEYIIDIMNKVGYDLAVIGNHEFDYGMDRLSELIDKANAKYLGCNIIYTGTKENALADVKPYEIID